MLQNSAGQVWERRLEERNLYEQISKSYEAVIKLAGHYNVDLPTASDMLALRRMHELALYHRELQRMAAALAGRIRLVGPEDRKTVGKECSGVFVAVEILIDGRVFDAEIRAQINDLAALAQERHRVLRGHAVRQRQEYDLRLLRQQFRVWFGKAQTLCRQVRRKLREDLSQCPPGVLPRSDYSQLGARVPQQQPHEFFAGITRSADDCYLFGGHKNGCWGLGTLEYWSIGLIKSLD